LTEANEKPRWDFAVLAIILAGAALRFIALGQQSYWVDETRSISIAMGEHQVSWIDSALNIHGPLHLMLLKLWMVLVGTGEVATRALSAIFGAIGLVLFYRLGVLLTGRRTATIALVLLAISPFYLWYNQETRNYSLLFDVGLLAIPAFLAEIEKKTRKSFAAALGLGVVLCLSNLTGFFLLAVYGFYAIALGRRNGYPLRRALLLLLIVVVVLSPWIMEATGQLGNPHLGRPNQLVGEGVVVRGESPWGIFTVPYTFYNFSLGLTMGPSIHELKEFHWNVVAPFLPYLIPAMALFVATALWGMVTMRRTRGSYLILIAWLTIPVVLMMVLSLLNLKAANSRYATLAFAPYLLFVAAGIAAIRRKYPRWIVMGVLLFYCAHSDYNHFTNPRYWRPDARAVGQVLDQHGRETDALVACGVVEPVEFYAPGHVAIYYRPELGSLYEMSAAEQWLRETTAGKQRLWYVKIDSWWGDPGNRLLRACQHFMLPRGEWQFEKAPLYLFEVPAEWQWEDAETGG
jgi:uncharacterized membrane protein